MYLAKIFWIWNLKPSSVLRSYLAKAKLFLWMIGSRRWKADFYPLLKNKIIILHIIPKCSLYSRIDYKSQFYLLSISKKFLSYFIFYGLQILNAEHGVLVSCFHGNSWRYFLSAQKRLHVGVSLLSCLFQRGVQKWV